VNSENTADNPLRVGQYVNALIAGQVLRNVFVIPRAALREEREVLIMNADNKIERRAVTVAWSDEQNAAISEGLSSDDLLIVTPFSTVSDGTPVEVLGDQKSDVTEREELK